MTTIARINTMSFLELLGNGREVLLYIIYFAVMVYFLNLKSHFDRVWIVIVAAIWFGLVEVSQGKFWDIFPSNEWTFSFALSVSLLVLVLAGIPFSTKIEIVLLVIALYFFLLENNLFWANLIAIVGYLIIVTGFLKSSIQTIEHWLKPETEKSQ